MFGQRVGDRCPLSFGPTPIRARTNAKTAIPALLDTLDVVSSIVSIDIIAFQPSIVGNAMERKTDCVIALKKERQNPL